MITTTRVTVHGYGLHMMEAGNGPAVLLLHGFAVSSLYWQPTLELLGNAGYRAIAIDVLGFGDSDKPPHAPYSLHLYADLCAGLLDVLGLEQATVVGHSFGGKLALATAVLHQPRVRRLVVMDTDGFLQVPTIMRRITSLPGVGKGMLWLAGRDAVVRAQLRVSFRNPDQHVTPEMIARGRDAMLRPENGRVLMQLSHNATYIDLRTSGLRARLSELRCPTLIVWGEDDRVIPLSCGETARREIPGAHLVRFPNCGHFPHVEAFRAFHGLLLGFLAGNKEAL